MDQKKIGSFLKELRKEKNITQERLAGKLGVSGRTVSRWETGYNMPDISLLVEIADIFEVSIPEIINGERKSEIMNEEIKETAQSLSDYATVEKEEIVKEIRKLSLCGLAGLIIYYFIEISHIGMSNEWIQNIQMLCQAWVYVVVLLLPLQTTGILNKHRKNEKSNNIPKVLIYVASIAATIVLAIAVKLLFNL